MDSNEVAKSLAEDKIVADSETIEHIIKNEKETETILEKVKDEYSNSNISKEDVEGIELSKDDSSQDYSEYDSPEEFKRILEFELSDCRERAIRESDYDISGDISGKSYGSGEIESYIELFRDRYKKLSGLLKRHLEETYPLGFVNSKRGGDYVSLIGIVNEVRDTQKGNKLVKIEDTNDEALVVFYEEEIFDKCDEIVEDEVIGISGRIADNGEIVFGEDLYFPDISPNRTMNKSNSGAKVALISDLHIGGQEFAAEKWQRFTNWVRQKEDLKYMVVAGDLVDGVGVYPEQDKELSVTSVEEQYQLCAKAFEKFPDDLEIIVSPGNHDTPRLAEPQPQLREEYREMFPDNVRMTSNPALVEIEGVKIEVYHGMSIKELSDSIPDLEMEEAEGAMEQMLKKRHLNPIFGGDNRIAPENEDYLVLEEAPDVLHCGHVHKLRQSEYRNVRIINSGCWQKITEFQKQKNIVPDVGTAPILDLSTGKIEVKEF